MPHPDSYEYYLTFGGSIVGTKIHQLLSGSIEMNAPAVIKPFWRKEVIIDGRWPAVTYNWPFEVVVEGNSIVGYIGAFHALDWMNDRDNVGPTLPRTLLMTDSASNVLMSFGACYFAGASQKTPSELLITSTGIVEVKFMGSSSPVLDPS